MNTARPLHYTTPHYLTHRTKSAVILRACIHIHSLSLSPPPPSHTHSGSFLMDDGLRRRRRRRGREATAVVTLCNAKTGDLPLGHLESWTQRGERASTHRAHHFSKAQEHKPDRCNCMHCTHERCHNIKAPLDVQLCTCLGATVRTFIRANDSEIIKGTTSIHWDVFFLLYCSLRAVLNRHSNLLLMARF